MKSAIKLSQLAIGEWLMYFRQKCCEPDDDFEAVLKIPDKLGGEYKRDTVSIHTKIFEQQAESQKLVKLGG